MYKGRAERKNIDYNKFKGKLIKDEERKQSSKQNRSI
jgi:hypothetical protein